MALPLKLFLAIYLAFVLFFVEASTSSNPIGVCIRNCAQCKKMFGSYFDGGLCADTCVKFKGKFVPDCEDAGSIAPFIVSDQNNV